MFGGLAFMLNGHMCCGVLDNRLVLRLGEAGAREALEHEHAASMDFTGRTIRTMAYLAAPAIAADDDLRAWIGRATRFTTGRSPRSAARRYRKSSNGRSSAAVMTVFR